MDNMGWYVSPAAVAAINTSSFLWNNLGENYCSIFSDLQAGPQLGGFQDTINNSTLNTLNWNFGSTTTPKPNKRKSTNYHLPNSMKKVKKLPISEKVLISSSSSSSNISFEQQQQQPKMKEMIYRAAILRPVVMRAEGEVGEKVVAKRKNVRISNEPQTVAARQRRERIGERMRELQKLVPGASKMDTASMLDEAANYLKFLKSQLNSLENLHHNFDDHYFLNYPNPNLLSYLDHSFPSPISLEK